MTPQPRANNDDSQNNDTLFRLRLIRKGNDLEPHLYSQRSI